VKLSGTGTLSALPAKISQTLLSLGTPFHTSLQAKFIAVIVLIQIVLMGLVTVVIKQQQQEIILEESRKRAFALANNLAALSEGYLLTYNFVKLKQTADKIAAEEDVAYTIVQLHNGQVAAYSGHQSLQGTILEDPISQQAIAAEKPFLQEVTTATLRGAGYDVAIPVFAPGGTRKWGTIRIGFSLARARQEIQRTTRQLFLLGVLAVLLGTWGAVFLARRISKPIQQLVIGVKKVTNMIDTGHLDYRMNFHSQDELGHLAAAFDHMAEELQKTAVSRDYVDNILRSMRDSLVVVSPAGRMLTVNEATCTLLGYTENELIGQPFATICGTDFPDWGLGLAVSRKTKGISNIETTYVTKDGRTIPVSFSFAVMGNQQGMTRGIVCVAQDMTARKQAEERIKASLQEKEVLLKEIHHRVKNNLQVIASLLSLQSSYITDPKAFAMFADTQYRVESIALIHETLYQAKDLAQIDFAEYVQHLAMHLFRSYEVYEDTITLQIHVESLTLGVDTAIPCGLILNELVSNALKHAFPAGMPGKIGIELHAEPAQMVTLRVWDTGVGFPKEVDLHHTASLGLQLVTTLVYQQLRGTIALQRNGGTVFTIRFPIARE
jgi:PAS domain S-box-containing protein